MRGSSLIILLIIIIFTGVWYARASSFGIYLDESLPVGSGEGLARTGSVHYSWNYNSERLEAYDPKGGRGLILTYLCALAFKMPGDALVWCRSVPLFFTFLTFLIVVFYYRRHGVLTHQRMLVWAILFFGSSIILDLSYYTFGYVPMGTAMTMTFILYWEGLIRFRQKNIGQAVFLWVLGLIPVGITVMDQWQIEGVPTLGIAIITSIAAFNKQCAPLVAFVKRKSTIFLWGMILIAPIVLPKITHIPWITLSGVHILNGFFATYWDNDIGWLRFILAVNVALLALGWAFKSKIEMTFDRWMFINGFLTGIVCILYNSHNHIFFPKFVYLPALMMIIGLVGIMEDFFIKKPIRIIMLAIYVVINMGVSWVNTFEHSNVKLPVQWLNTHLTPEDILLSDYGGSMAFHYSGGEKLLSREYLINDSTNKKYASEFRKYIYSHPEGRIFYFYDDPYGFRFWLSSITTGRDRELGIDLCRYLKHQIPSTVVMPGLRQCGLVAFDHTVLLNGLDQLLRNGFVIHHRYTLQEFFNHVKSILITR